MRKQYSLPALFLKHLSLSSCFVCEEGDSHLCDQCLTELSCHHAPWIEPGVYAHYVYKKSFLSPLLKAAKYSHKHNLYEPLCTDSFMHNLSFLQGDGAVIIPLPMHYLRALYRGKNHANTIARLISNKLHIPCDTKLLQRVRYTKTQAKKHKNERLADIKNSFIVPLERRVFLQGKTILLVDDVYTTGATTQEAKRTLLASGAEQVYIITLAH